ncbi:MAG TPA: hemin ABC transporter substrate-binding protein, partial [Myxococcales bacterium]|nr:hemin ABC transporter substrate-binding protein [Myxococcales bacterium]
EGTRKRIAAIAKILGKQSEGKALIDSLDQDMKAVKQSTEVKKVLFIYARGAGAVSVAGQKTAADAMIRLAGGVNAVQEYEGYKPINAESIVSAAPDLILLTTRGLKSIGGADGVSKLKGVSLTPAGKNKNILAIDDLMLLGFGPRTGKALRQLAEALK